MAYGYLDQYKIFHIVDDEETAKKYASSKVVPTDIPNGEGYPEHEGRHVIVYTAKGEYKIGGAMYPISQLEKTDPQIAALVAELVK